MRSRLTAAVVTTLALVLLLGLAVGAGPMAAPAAAASGTGRSTVAPVGEARPSTTLPSAPARPAPDPGDEGSADAGATPDIIPQPNSGQRPNSPGDRGGSEQTALFLLICGAIVLLGVLAYLDGRRNKRRSARRRPDVASASASRPPPPRSSSSSDSSAP